MENRGPSGKIKINVITELHLITPVKTSGSGPQKNTYSSELECIFQTPDLERTDFEYQLNFDKTGTIYYHFPALVHVHDGSPWAVGNLYILELATSYPPPPSSTLRKIAQSLIDFNSEMLIENLDMFAFGKSKALRPTYAYSFKLAERAMTNPSSLSSSNQHLMRIENMYRWVVSKRNLLPDHEMWKEKKLTRQIKDRYGKDRTIEHVTTDLRIPKTAANKHTSRAALEYSAHQNDGPPKRVREKYLRAYDEDEQLALLDTLLKIKNIEMTLIFMIALTSGARLQSVLTIPRSEFEREVKTDYLVVNIGLGASTDSKSDGINKLYIPKFIAKWVSIYLKSKRYASREAKSERQGGTDNYTFLTKNGRPYYAKKNDQYRGKYQTDPLGQGVHTFIYQQLQPMLLERNVEIDIRFHNLRATFANNLANNEIKRFREGVISWTQVLITVGTRLGHKSLEVTERYLEDIKRDGIAALTQDRWEAYLEERILNSSGEGGVTDGTDASQL